MFDETDKYRVISHQLGSSLTDQIPIAIVGSPLKITNKEKKVSNRSAVFGGAGFIGTNLVYQLIEDGQQVFNFDNPFRSRKLAQYCRAHAAKPSQLCSLRYFQS